MAERQRHASAKVSIGELLVVRDIGAADAGGLDGNLYFANSRILNRSSFLDSVVLVDVVLKVENMRLKITSEGAVCVTVRSGGPRETYQSQVTRSMQDRRSDRRCL
jgi:hypothetical protein